MQLQIIEPAFGQKSTEADPVNPDLSESTMFNVDGVSYLISPEPQDRRFLIGATGTEPLTVFHIDGEVITLEWLKCTIDRYLKLDDVFERFFLRSTLFQTTVNTLRFETGVKDHLRSLGNTKIYISSGITPQEMLPLGPYFSSFSGIHEVFRLYEDTSAAFVVSTISSQKGTSFRTVQAAACGTQNLVVAVPSRLRFKKSEAKPLAGVRIAVKDLLHLKGVCTSGGSRAYQKLYPKQQLTAPLIQRLIDKGAIIVGKTKTAEFGGPQEVLGDWSDFLCPFNPRGDGDLNALSSSTGSAVAIAAYPWLDLALATDGGGSVRDPSRDQGIYGLRPTHDGDREVGSIAPAPMFQRSGVMGRDISELLVFTKQWLNCDRILGRNESRLPKKLLIISDYAAESSESQPIFDDFTFMGVMGADFYNEFADFRQQYSKKYGRRPYTSPPTRWVWDLFEQESPEKRVAALQKIKIHNEWFRKHVLEDDPIGSSDTIILIPHPPLHPLQYRDDYGR
ncbi:hypothetical protein H072_7422 [Dactylellina haptotyla CBS 200.50]|uniref:Uncharacterized protein n=1 Tax=Dactylellina haptotyla (strain CBS 200.50) TaxID=1284197 RepID=S8A743_DACHA|nr:hypothetical protein H072_7422 [Dactylellina haptotyla CBS 200.50]